MEIEAYRKSHILIGVIYMRIFHSLDSSLRGNDNNDQACTTKWNNHPIWIHWNLMYRYEFKL